MVMPRGQLRIMTLLLGARVHGWFVYAAVGKERIAKQSHACMALTLAAHIVDVLAAGVLGNVELARGYPLA